MCAVWDGSFLAQAIVIFDFDFFVKIVQYLFPKASFTHLTSTVENNHMYQSFFFNNYHVHIDLCSIQLPKKY